MHLINWLGLFPARHQSILVILLLRKKVIRCMIVTVMPANQSSASKIPYTWLNTTVIWLFEVWKIGKFLGKGVLPASCLLAGCLSGYFVRSRTENLTSWFYSNVFHCLLLSPNFLATGLCTVQGKDVSCQFIVFRLHFWLHFRLNFFRLHSRFHFRLHIWLHFWFWLCFKLKMYTRTDWQTDKWQKGSWLLSPFGAQSQLSVDCKSVNYA